MLSDSLPPKARSPHIQVEILGSCLCEFEKRSSCREEFSLLSALRRKVIQFPVETDLITIHSM